MGGWRFSLGLENAVSIRLPGCLCPRDERSQVGMGNKSVPTETIKLPSGASRFHRITAGLKQAGPPGPSGTGPAPAGTPRARCPGPPPGAFGGLQEDSPASGQPVAALRHRELPSAQRELLCSALCLWPLALALGTAEQSLAPSSVRSPFRDPRVRVTRAEQAQRF